MTKVNNAGIASLSIKSPDDVTGWLALVSARHATIHVMVVHRHGRGSCKSRAPPPCATQRARLTPNVKTLGRIRRKGERCWNFKRWVMGY